MSWGCIVLLLFAWNSRAGKYELTIFATFIDKMSYSIPQNRKILPFIYQTRRWTFKKNRRFCLDRGAIFVHIVRILQLDNTLCVFLARASLSAPFRPLNQDGTHAFKIEIQDFIYNTSLVFRLHLNKFLFCNKLLRNYSIYRHVSSMSFPKNKSFYSRKLKHLIPES